DRVEAVALLGRVATVDAVAVAMAGAHARQVAVPVVGRALDHVDALLGPVLVEQAQLDVLGVLGEEREVRALAVPRRAERERRSGPGLAARDLLAHRAIRAPARAGRRTPPWPSVALWVASATVRPCTGTVRAPAAKLQASSKAPRCTRS